MPDCQKEKEELFLEIAKQHQLKKKLMQEKKDLTQRYNKGLQELNDNLQSDCDKISQQIRSVCKKDKEKLESDYKAKIEKHLKEIARLKQVKKVLKDEVIKLREERETQKQKIMEAEVAIAANVSHQGTIKKHMNEIARLKRENKHLTNLPPTPDRKVSGGRKRKKTRRKRRKRRKRRTKRKSRSRRN